MSDNELDAELLAMAGEGSDDEGEVDSPGPSAAPSPTPEPKPSVEEEEDTTISRKGVAQKVRAKRRKRKYASEQEDEASPSPARSLGSSAMARSSSERDAPASPVDDDERPLYPIEGKFLSANEKAEIMAMPEIKREEILAERAAEVTKRQQDMQLKKALAAAQTAGHKAKRKAEAADLEEGGRRTTRPRAEKVPTALEKYKAAREQKGADRGRQDVAKTRKDERSPSAASDRDADGESDVEWAEQHSDKRPDEPLPELREFDLVRVGRTNFAMVSFYPHFETSVTGCFARINIGVDNVTGQNRYRMTEIAGFTEGKPYKLEHANGSSFTTDQYVIAAQGNDMRPFPFSFCSEGNFTPAEFERYKEHLRGQNKQFPTRKQLQTKLTHINKLLARDWTDAEITAKVARQKAMERKYDPVYAAKVKRDEILRRKAKAEDEGDFDEVDKCQAELKELSGTSGTAAVGKPSAAKLAAMSQQDRLAQINLRNRGKNSEEVRKALLEEKRKLRAARAAEAKAIAQREAAKKEAGEKKGLLAVPNDTNELFGEASDASRAATPSVGTPKRSRAATPLNGVKKEKGPLGALRSLASDDDLFASVDLGIDIEI